MEHETVELTLDQLKRQKRWTIHRDKRPLNPHNGQYCNKAAQYREKSSSARTVYCLPYDEAVDAIETWGGDGVGLYSGLGSTGAFVWGIDLDDCFDENKNLKPLAKKIVDRCDTYTEVSGSGKGLHLLGVSEQPLLVFKDLSTGEKKEQGTRMFKDVPDGADGTIHSVELYSDGHYIRQTEDIYGEPKPLRNISKVVLNLLTYLDKQKYKTQQTEAQAKKAAKKKAPKQPAVAQTGNPSISAAAIQKRMRGWKDKALNVLLDSTDAIPKGFPSGSEADGKLLFAAASITHDVASIKNFMYSLPRATARAERWEQGGWLEREIEKAIEAVQIRKPKKKRASGSSTVVKQRKEIPSVPIEKLQARIDGLPDGATDAECQQYAVWVKSRIAPLVTYKRERLEGVLKACDLKQEDVLKPGFVDSLAAIADAMEATNDAGYMRALERFKAGNSYLLFTTDKRYIAGLLFAWLRAEIRAVLHVDKVNKSKLFETIVLPEIKRCIKGRTAITAYGIQQKNTYPEQQQHCLVAAPVQAMANPKNKDHVALKRSEGKVFKVPNYPELVLTMGLPEDANLTLYDKVVADALYSIAKWNNTVYIPLELLCKVIKGNRNASINQSDKERAKQSLRALNSVWVKYTNGNKYIEGSFINAFIYGETINGVEDTATVFLNGLQLGYEYSNVLKHVITYGTYYREVPGLKLTNDNALIVQYMLTRLLLARRMTKQRIMDGRAGIWTQAALDDKTTPLTIYYDTVFERTGVTLNDSNKGRRADKQAVIVAQTIPVILDYWKEIGLIKSYDTLDEDAVKPGVVLDVKLKTQR